MGKKILGYLASSFILFASNSANSLDQSLRLIGTTTAHELGFTGDINGTIVIIDEGLDVTEFGCTATGVPADTCSIIETISFVETDGQPEAYTSVLEIGGVTKETHGTSVARMILSVAPQVKIISLDAGRSTSSNTAGIQRSAEIKALKWIENNRDIHNIKFVNMSFGTFNRDNTCSENAGNTVFRLRNLSDLGITLVAASGNTESLDLLASPACLSYITSVGSVGSRDITYDEIDYFQDQRAENSSISSELDFLAPGHVITYSAYNTNRFIGGTSYAAPFVTGSLAVLAQAFPNKSNEFLLDRLKSTGVMLTENIGTGMNPPTKVFPRLSIGRAVPKPDLAPTIRSGWSGALVLRNDTDCEPANCSSETNFSEGDTIYASFSLKNIGELVAKPDTSLPIISFFVDGRLASAVLPNGDIGINARNTALNIRLGQFASGTHSIRAVLDETDGLIEASRSNNLSDDISINISATSSPSNRPPFKPSAPRPALTGSPGLLPVDSAELSWSGGDPDNGDIVEYIVFFEPADDSPDQRVCEGITNESCIVNGLIPDTLYYWEVYAQDRSGLTSISDVFQFRTRAESRPATNPSPAQGATISPDNVILNWEFGGTELGSSHRVFFEKEDTSPDQTVCDNLPFRRCVIGNLEPNSNYYWEVYSTNEDNSAELSSTFSFSTGPRIFPDFVLTPQDGTLREPGAYELQWVGGGILPNSSVEVVFEKSDKTPNDILCSNPLGSTCLTGQLNAGNYYWKVINNLSSGEKNESPISLLTILEPFTTASNPMPATLSEIVSVPPLLRWVGGGRDDNGTLYTVFFEKDDDSPDQRLCEDVDVPRCAVNSVEADSTYYWQVFYRASDGREGIGPVWSFTTEAPPSDRDVDGVPDTDDNCPDHSNADQANNDNDLLGNVCDDDDDGDGMSDVFENTNGLNSLDASDAGLDLDGDGLTNVEEFSMNPLMNPNNPDTDGDGIDDKLDNQPIMSNNVCSGSDAIFNQVVTTDVICGAESSITVNAPANVQSPGFLQLIAPKVIFTNGFTSEKLTVISAQPCAVCIP